MTFWQVVKMALGGVGLSRRCHFLDKGSTEIASAAPSAILNSRI